MNESLEKFAVETAVKIPESYYDTGRKEFLIKDTRDCWISLPETSFKRQLRKIGVNQRPADKNGISEMDEVICRLQMAENVAWSGSLAGYKAGFYTVGSTRILVTTSPVIIEPVQGDWPLIRAVTEGLLSTEDGDQLMTVYAWLKVAYGALAAGLKHPGQVLVLCGPHGCGKSLLQRLITVLLGGRVARPYQAMSGGTAFNSDLFGAEHLSVEDEQPSTDIRARRAFGAQIKNATVNVDQRLHGKNRDGIILQPFWRMTVSLNSESENVQILPPLEDSLSDKLILCRTNNCVMPMPTGTPELRRDFWNALMAEMPAFIHYLTIFEIPESRRSERFGIAHYHHPEIVRMLNEVAPEYRLLSLIDSKFFAVSASHGGHVISPALAFIDRTAEEIESSLTSHESSLAFEARRLLSWNSACGTYLGRLAKTMPDRVQSLRTAVSRKWRITAPPTGDDGMTPG
jgi:energy-coupling factor transporter ATP-binding protein EcfA2